MSAFRAGALMLVLLAGAMFLVLTLLPLRRVSGDAAVPVVKVRRVDFLHVLRLAGTTKAVYSQLILAPRLAGAPNGPMVITSVAPNGTHVKKGQVLVEFDRQQQYKNFLQKEGDYRDFTSQVAVKQAGEEAARAKDNAALKQAEDAVEIAKLQVKQNAFVTRTQAEINNETLQEDQSTLKQLRLTYALKRQAAAAAIRNLQIQQQAALQAMRHAQQNEQRMVVRSPMDGIAVLTQVGLGGRIGYVQAGTSVYPGESFMRVVDPSRMDVSVLVNQADLPFLRVGQHAVVHLEAYPDLSFPARLEQLSPLGRPGQFSAQVMSFGGVFSIQGTSPKLMPDLSAAVDVQLQSEKDVLVVPVQSVATDAAGSYVSIENGSGFAKRRVRTGPENDLDVVIESGLASGDTIREYATGSGGGSSQP